MISIVRSWNSEKYKQTKNGKKRMKGLLKTPIVASLLWLVVAVTGCVTIESPDLAIQPVDRYSLYQVKDDLFVAVEPFHDKEKVLRYFGANLLSDGILPVLTVAENHSRTSSFVLLKEQFSLTSPNKTRGSQEADFVLEPFPETTATLIGLIGLHLSTSASKIRHNLITRELKTKTIAPGSSQYGFVYFKLRDKTDAMTMSAISVKALNLQTDEVITFIFSGRGI